MTRDELNKYVEKCGAESGAALLLLGGADFYDGDYDEYMRLVEELEAKAEDDV